MKTHRARSGRVSNTELPCHQGDMLPAYQCVSESVQAAITRDRRVVWIIQQFS
jgi:methylthioribose-1-phosphate isomerase